MATTKERSGPLLLLDGMSLAFRAYFALPDSLATTTGLVTNAVYGFSSMLVYLIREHRPSALAVAFDPPGDTFRDEMLEDYKAGRAETPALLPPQFDMIREVLGALAIPVVEVPGYEADDVIATLATEAASRDSEVVIVTGDRDSFQLIRDPYIRVLYNKRGVSDYALYDEAGIFERTGVPPSQYVLLAALRGDPSDNLPGVPGVGEKTAAKLLTSYGDLDGIFGHLDELTPKLRENLAANEHLARSNAEVIPLVTDVPLLVDVGELTLGGWNLEDAEDVFTRFEMKTVWQRLEELLEEGRLGEPAEGSARPGAGRGAPGNAAAPAGGGAATPEPTAPAFELRDVAVPATAAEATTQLGALGTGTLALAARWTGTPGRSELAGLVLVATEGDEAGLGVLVPGTLLSTASVAKKLNTVLSRAVVGHDVKEAMRSLLPLGIDLTGLEMDTAVAAYLLDASTGEYALQQLREQTGQLTLDILEPGETRATRPRTPRRRRSTSPAWPPASGSASSPRAWCSCTTTSRLRWSGYWPRWKWPASASTGASCRRSPTRWRRRRPRCRTRCRSSPATSSTSTRPRSCAPSSTRRSASRPGRRRRPVSRPTPRRWRASAARIPLWRPC